MGTMPRGGKGAETAGSDADARSAPGNCSCLRWLY